MRMKINDKEYFESIKSKRKELFSRYDSILYPQVNNDLGIPIYFHIKDENMKHDIFNFTSKYGWREVEEVITARSYSNPKSFSYIDKDEYELTIGDEINGVQTFYARIVSPMVTSVYITDGMEKCPPVYLVKNNKIIGIAANPFLTESKDYFRVAFDIYNSEIADYNYEFFRENHIKITVMDSIKSKIENMDFKLDKRYLIDSPYLEKGLTFYVNDMFHCMWKDDTYFYVQTGKYNRFPCILSFRLEDMPSILSKNNIKKMIMSKIKNNIENGIDTPSKLGQEDRDYPLVEYLHNNALIAHDCFLEIDEISETGEYSTTDISVQGIVDCHEAILYCLTVNTPEMRKYVKGGSKSNIEFNFKNINRFITKKWNWGNNKVRYVYPKRKSSNRKISHYTRPHLCKFYIKNLEKYQDYNPIKNEGKFSIVKWREGCWKGNNMNYFMGNHKRGYSRKAIGWLMSISKNEDIQIQHAENGGEVRVELGNGKYYLLDGYCKETNTVYEFHGDVFHGNPKLFNAEDKCHPYNDMTAGELLDYTLKKEDDLRKMGFNVVSIWESEWDMVV